MAAKQRPVPRGRTVVGLVEKVTVKRAKVVARIDTGATKSSIDVALAERLGLGPVVGSRLVKSANGSTHRKVVKLTVTLAGKRVTCIFTLADRSHMKYKMLIGQNMLKRGFLIDPGDEEEE